MTRSFPPTLGSLIMGILASGLFIAACSGGPTDTLSDPIVAADIVNVVGVPDRGLDPSTVALTNARGDICSGVLLASNVVLTARRCVTKETIGDGCPLIAKAKLTTDDPGNFHVYSGSPSAGATWASAGIAVFTADDEVVCGADLAAIVLEWPMTGIAPALLSASGIPEGGHVRTVGFASTFDPDAGSYASSAPWVSFEREHVPVLNISASELAIGEATCFTTPR